MRPRLRLRCLMVQGRPALTAVGSGGAISPDSMQGCPRLWRMPMTVKAILSGKGNAVITIEPTVPLGDAVKILEEHGIGAAVITDTDQHVLGILSERDIVRTLARNVRAGGACRLLRRVRWTGDDAGGPDVHAIRHSPRDHGAHDRGQVSPSSRRRARQTCRNSISSIFGSSKVKIWKRATFD